MDYLVEACERQLQNSMTKGASNRNFFRVGFAEQVHSYGHGKSKKSVKPTLSVKAAQH